MKKFICGFFLVLCACSFRSPNSTFYMMNSQNLEPISTRQINVAVARIKVPELLARSQMVVYESDSDEVQIMEFNRWGEVFPDMLQATVTNDLVAFLPNAFVKRTYFDSGKMSYSVNIEINNIQAYSDGKVILSAWWNITNSSGYVVKRQQVSYQTEAKGKSTQDLVNAQSEAVHQMSRGIAEALMNI